MRLEPSQGEPDHNSGQLRDLANALCRSAKLDPPVGLVPLAGGKNNRVLRVDLANGDRVILKCYHHDLRDLRDRLAAEWRFLIYAAERGLREVPTPLSQDPSAHAGLYSFIEGTSLTGVATGSHVSQALRFVERLNSLPRRSWHHPW